MSRVPLVTTREALAPPAQAVFDSIMSSRGIVGGPFALLLHEPELARRVAQLGSYIRFESDMLSRDRELAILAVAVEMNCEYEWTFHEPLALKADVPASDIAAIQAAREPAGEGADVVRYVRALLRSHRVDSGDFDALAVRLGSRGLIALTTTIGYYAMLAYLLNAFDITAAAKQA